MLSRESWGDYVRELALGQKDNKIPFSVMLNGQTQPCKDALAKLGEVIKQVNIVEMVTPLNAAEERKIWLTEARKGNFTSPQYRYDERLLDEVIKLDDMKELQPMRAWAAKLVQGAEVNAHSAAAGLIVLRCFEETQLAVRMAKGIRNSMDDITGMAIEELFGVPSETTVQEAKLNAKYLANGQGMVVSDAVIPKTISQRLEELEFGAKGIAQVFNWAAERCGFAGTRPVIISKTATAIDVRDKSSQGAVVVIPQKRRVTGKKLVALTAHEVLCHWRDSENIGSMMAGNLKSHDEILYEGHAMTVERDVNLLLDGKAAAMPKPWYVLAIALAKDGRSFAEVARELYPMILDVEKDESKALKLTYTSCQRVFRGATDPSDGRACYAFTKDRAYFEGVMLVDELRQAGLGSLAEYGILGTSDLLQIGTICHFDPENMRYAYSIEILYELIDKMLGGRFSSL